ncbi:Rep [uncultured virus]|uniref:ATP-dependent helicase Rep n=1 Tax=uncultured virus TaxID=340016 RepID=A0A2K9LSS3_9VIRU|nr:Rep [uncultured virus]
MIRQNPKQTSKYWCYTLNNPAPNYELPPADLWTYHIYGREVGESGTPHLQGYIEMYKPYTFVSMKNLLPGAHIEKRQGSGQQASDYCKKDGDYTENGTLAPPRGYAGGAATKRRYEEAFETAINGDMNDIDKDLLTRHYHAYKRIKQDNPTPPEALDNVCGLWYVGPPNTGKSYAARERYPNLYDKPANKWFDGYRGEDTVLIDDFDMNHKVLGHHLKRWADRYAFPAEQKGTTIAIRPQRIIVTSNYYIEEIFSEDKVLVEALKRRFTVEEFSEIHTADK